MTDSTDRIDRALQSDAAARFSHGELQLFGHLEELLRPVAPDQTDELLDQLRDRLLDGPPNSGDKAKRHMAASIKACRVCDEVEPDPTNGHWNLQDPDLLLVTSTPLTQTPGNELLLQGLKRAEFSSQRVGALSVVRCAPKTPQPQDEHITNCTTRYLFNQVQLLRPKLLMGFGALASSLLLANPQFKVTEHIGEIFWVGPWAVQTTISPSYAAHHPAREEALHDCFVTAHRFLYDKADDT